MNLQLVKAGIDVTSYDKNIEFTYNGETYEVILHWDNQQGYELMWVTYVEQTPQWAEDYYDETGEDLEYALDVLTNLEVNL